MCVNVEKILYLTCTTMCPFFCPQLPSFSDFNKALHYYIHFPALLHLPALHMRPNSPLTSEVLSSFSEQLKLLVKLKVEAVTIVIIPFMETKEWG